jgi:hypothetical protein
MPNDPANAIRFLAGRLASARGVVVLTGAGVSAESGIRTFRDAADEATRTMAGLWKDFDPAKLATPEAFDADPTLVTRWSDLRRRGCLAATPNPGHLALAEMQRRVESRGGRFTLLTQNSTSPGTRSARPRREDSVSKVGRATTGASAWVFGAAFFFSQPQISNAEKKNNDETRMTNEE